MIIKGMSQRDYNRLDQQKRRRQLGKPTRAELYEKHKNTFLERAMHIHHNQYDYSKVEYIVQHKKVIITCLIHGDFQQTPNAHINGKQGCPRCAHQKRVNSRKRKSPEDFISQAIEKHFGRYLYNKTVYTNIQSKVIITCPDHGDFMQGAKEHLKGQGCPTCANIKRNNFTDSKGEKIIEQWLTTNKIGFEKQKEFVGCRYKMQLRYDFYVPCHNLVIEFDGQQHFEFVKKFHKTHEQFIKLQARDKIKNEFATTVGMSMLRIRYDQQNDIQKILQQRFLN